MERHADYVEEDSVLRIYPLRDLHQHGVLHIPDQHILGIAAVGAADAGGAREAVDTDVGLALSAGGAVLGAVGGRAAENLVTHLVIGDALAHLNHGAHVLMAQDHGQLYEGRDRAYLIKLHVGSANTNIVDLDH